MGKGLKRCHHELSRWRCNQNLMKVQGLNPIPKSALSHVCFTDLSRPKSVYFCNCFVPVFVRVILCLVHCGVLVFASGRSYTLLCLLSYYQA